MTSQNGPSLNSWDASNYRPSSLTYLLLLWELWHRLYLQLSHSAPDSRASKLIGLYSQIWPRFSLAIAFGSALSHLHQICILIHCPPPATNLLSPTLTASPSTQHGELDLWRADLPLLIPLDVRLPFSSTVLSLLCISRAQRPWPLY